MPRWILVSFVLACLALAWAVRTSPSGGSGGGPGGAGACVLAPAQVPGLASAPLQSPLPRGQGAFRHGRFFVEPLAAFSLQARVLGREDYRFDAAAELAPVDLALGWGRMADPAVYGQLAITQGGRWYHYRWGPAGPPVPLEEIIRSSANMHLVPATPEVARALSSVRAGEVVALRGWLVEARRDDGYVWRSSLTREDSGGGACELIYVCAVERR